MKFILFNINNTNKTQINKIKLDDKHYLNEVSLSKENLDKIYKQEKSFLKIVRNKWLEKDIEKKIIKSLEAYDKKWYYIISKEILDASYIKNKSAELLGYKLECNNELDNNLLKYIDEYTNKNSLKKHELKVLLVVSTNNRMNFDLLNSLINKCKSVNIYLKEKPSPYTLKKIKQINKNKGTVIEILKKERKVFSEYNVVYFMDDLSSNYPRFRLNKEALVLDVDMCKKDKFNSSIIFMNKYLTEEGAFKENIDKLLKEYSELEIANMLTKIIN